MERSEKRRRSRQVALELRDGRLLRDGIHVVRYNIENLINFSLRFWETTTVDIGSRVLAQHGNIAWIESLGFVEVVLAFVPLSSPPLDIGQRFRNLAAIGEELTRLLKVTLRGVVIL